MTEAAKYIRGYNGLRALSILFVLLTHLGLYDGFLENPFFADRVLRLVSGITGVNIFFALSGFLISRILLTEKYKNGGISFRKFYIRRFLRLLPPLAIYYMVIAVLMYFNLVARSYTGLLFSMFYLYNFLPNKFYTSELGHTWSLGVEEQFYLFWPVIIHYFKKFRIVLLALLIIVFCIFVRMYLPQVSFAYKGKTYPLANNFMLGRWFIPAALPIMIGSLFAVMIVKAEHRSRHFFENRILLLLIAVLLFLSPLYLPSAILPFLDIFQATGISLLLSWILFNQHSKLCDVLEYWPIAYLGKISYGVYVYHGLFIRTGPGGNLFIQKFPLNILLTLLTAVLSYEFVEKKVLSYKAKFN